MSRYLQFALVCLPGQVYGDKTRIAQLPFSKFVRINLLVTLIKFIPRHAYGYQTSHPDGKYRAMAAGPPGQFLVRTPGIGYGRAGAANASCPYQRPVVRNAPHERNGQANNVLHYETKHYGGTLGPACSTLACIWQFTVLFLKFTKPAHERHLQACQKDPQA